MQTSDLYKHQTGKLRNVLEDFYELNDDQQLKDFIQEVQSACRYLNDAADANGSYLTVLARSVKDRIFDAYFASRAEKAYPEIVLVSELDLFPLFAQLGLKSPGSPQDVVYNITSERSAGWVPSLTQLGFFSAYMSGPGTCTLLTSQRLLNVANPQKELDELKGAIAADFFINLDLIKKTKPDLKEILERLDAPWREEWDEHDIQEFFNEHSQSANGYLRGLVAILIQDFWNPKKELKTKVRAWNTALKPRKTRTKPVSNASTPTKKKKAAQEQLVLKYMKEANLLQKFLGGKIVDHVQSNLKMQPNPLRKNKVEVDSVYGVIGSSGQEIVIVEAKGGTEISNTQLYGLYEAYRLRLPPKCELTLIAALVEDDDDSIFIDLIKVSFLDEFLTDPTASILNMSIDKHYKWRISR